MYIGFFFLPGANVLCAAAAVAAWAGIHITHKHYYGYVNARATIMHVTARIDIEAPLSKRGVAFNAQTLLEPKNR